MKLIKNYINEIMLKWYLEEKKLTWSNVDNKIFLDAKSLKQRIIKYHYLIWYYHFNKNIKI